MENKFEIIKDLLIDLRENHYNEIKTMIEGALGNDDITEAEAAELGSAFLS